MSTHSFFAPSKAAMWVECHGALVFPENTRGGTSSTFADDGTASHAWASVCLKSGADADSLLGLTMMLNGVLYTMDDDRAVHVQTYLDDVRMRAMGGDLIVEQWLPIVEFGKDADGNQQGGTGDAIIVQAEQKLLIVEDLKYGMGERVFAKENHQGLSYSLGMLPIVELLYAIDPSWKVKIVICQPRLNHIDEWECTVGDVIAFGQKAARAIAEYDRASIYAVNSPDHELYLNPSYKTCRWCNAKSRCTKLAKVVAEEVRMDFETAAAEQPAIPDDTAALERALAAVPLIDIWCKAVYVEVDRRVRAGQQVVGTDGLPMKIVEGKQGDREWIDKAQAEAALVGVLPVEKAYKPAAIITAAAAAKILDKRATKAMWTDQFVPLIKRAPGKPVLALGGDTRPPFSGAASADEFTDGSPEVAEG